MMASLDGRIDCAMTEQIDNTNSYYDALDSLSCNATLEGRVTLAMHYALPGSFAPSTPYARAGRRVFKAIDSDSYAVGVDTHGSLLWSDDVRLLFGRPLVMILSEDVSIEYLDYLMARNISFITTGAGSIDLSDALDVLASQFGVSRLAVVGGGHINAAFLQAGLLDEVSMMFGAAIDGRAGWTAAFDGIADQSRPATLLRLLSVKQLGQTVWLRYSVR